VQVSVRVFGGLTEVVGSSRVVVSVDVSAGEVPDVAALRAALVAAYPQLTAYLPRTAVAVDLAVAADDTVIGPDAEVALLPPVAGGSDDAVRVVTGLRAPPFDVTAVSDEVSTPASGATVVFLGRVRDHAPDLEDTVVGLEYTAYPAMAEHVLAEIAAEVVTRVPALTGVAALHAVGDLDVGDHTVLIVTAAGHRAEAFEACQWVLEEVKERVPVYKRERTAAGTHRWVGLHPGDGTTATGPA
jgi:MoaE-MoaD fusion protein